MERSEPTLVPGWLKNGGNLTGGGTASHLDDHASSRLARNKSFVNGNGLDFGRSSGTERTTSSYFRRSSSSNGSSHVRSYSGFGRSPRDRDRDRDWDNDILDSRNKDRSALRDRRHRDFSDPLGNALSSRFERDGLRRSQSMVSAKRGDTWPKKVASDSSSTSANGSLAKGNSSGGGLNKTIFERDFPSLGAEERSLVPEIGRVPSPGLSSAIQNLPIGTSAPITGEKWTSALAEVPVLVGSNGTATSSVQPTAASGSVSVGLGSTSSLNMAEAVAQGPSRTQTAPQSSVGSQRLEELAIKQSRQLIPVTPSLPKPLVLSSSDKQKSKIGQQQLPVSSSLPVNHSPRGAPLKGDLSKSSNVGKLQVLKPVREKNGFAPVPKDNLSPTNGCKVASSTVPVLPVSGPAATRVSQNNPIPDRKPMLTVLEKRPTAQAQSRNDFFNLVRKKSMSNSSSGDSAVTNTSSAPDTAHAESASSADKPDGVKFVSACSAPQMDSSAPSNESFRGNHLPEDRGQLASNGDACDGRKCVTNGKHLSSDPLFSEEEEAAFLRSLGWEENADEGGLTEEEINAFYRDVTKYINSKPSLKILQGVQPKFMMPFDSQIGGMANISSGLSSSDTKLES